MDLEDLDYDVATSPVKPEETWAHTEDDAPLSGAESEPRSVAQAAAWLNPPHQRADPGCLLPLQQGRRL